MWHGLETHGGFGSVEGEITMLAKIREKIQNVLASGDMPTRRPALKKNNESNIPGLYIVGDLAGAPVIKLAMAQGFEVIQHIASRPDAKTNDSGMYDLVVVGAGASGLNE